MNEIRPPGLGLPAASTKLTRPQPSAASPRVPPAERADAARPHLPGVPGQARTAAEARDIDALRREMERRGLQPGPPPAFKLSMLELDSDVRSAIARMDADRARTALGTAPDRTETPPAPPAGPQRPAVPGTRD